MNAGRCSRTEWRRIARFLAVALLLACGSMGRGSEDPARGATLIELQGPVGPAMSRFVEQSIRDAADRHSAVVILQMDTPGGLDTSMRAIIKAILASPLPVVTYVAPSGARAASAGTYILYASHFAAMAPATNLGAATPISIGDESQQHSEPAAEPKPSTKDKDRPPLSTGERKAVNDAVAYIRGLAQLRGRNQDWAENAVRGAASLSAQEALSQHVIDFVAKDESDLLQQLDGRRAQIAGNEVVLHTKDATLVRITPDWRVRMLMVFTHPTIAYGLLLIGIYGLLLEGYNPGAVLPGVVGALSLIVALYAFELLAVNFAGLALLILGVGLITLEFFMPAFGSLGIGGLAAFVIGSIILFDDPVQGLRVALPVIGGLAAAGALIIGTIAWLAARARRRPVATGAEAMIGELVQVVTEAPDHCVVRYGSELWNAQAATPLRVGQQARIVRVSGLTLWIEPA